MKLSKKDIVVLIAAASAVAGIFLPLVHVSVVGVGDVSFWTAEKFQWASGVTTKIPSIIMVVCACVFAALTLVEAKVPVLKFRKTIGFSGMLVMLIPIFLVLPRQLKSYYDQMTASKTSKFISSVTDSVGGSVANVGMKTVHFQVGLYLFAIGLVLCFVIGALKLAKKW